MSFPLIYKKMMYFSFAGLRVGRVVSSGLVLLVLAFSAPF
jgi:hypothetical protein